MDEDPRGSDGNGPGNREGSLAVEEVLDALGDDLTRNTLRYLLDHRSTTLERLATVLSGVEATRTKDITSPVGHRRIRVRLHHVVLPKLEAVGYVAYDVDDGSVTLGDVPPEVPTILEADLWSSDPRP